LIKTRAPAHTLHIKLEDTRRDETSGYADLGYTLAHGGIMIGLKEYFDVIPI